MLSNDQYQRLATFCAHHNRRTFGIARAFSEEFGRSFPTVRALMPLETKAQRFAFGETIASFAMNLRNLDAIGGWLESLGERLGEAGFDHRHQAAAKTALLNALREGARFDWNSQCESDWNCAIDEVFNRMGFGAVAAGAMRMAA